MKIIRNNKKVMFAELNPGDCFLYEDNLYMMGQTHEGVTYAVYLKDGKIKTADPIIMVRKVEAEVRVNE